MQFAAAEVPLLPPLARFAVVMLILFTVPPLCRRVGLPGVVGLLAAGVLVGPYGLHIWPRHAEVAQFFADIGKLLLMFFAGLEIDLAQFKQTRNRSVGFGLLTFAFPLTGIACSSTSLDENRESADPSAAPDCGASGLSALCPPSRHGGWTWSLGHFSSAKLSMRRRNPSSQPVTPATKSSIAVLSPRLIRTLKSRRWLRKRLAMGFELS
jgi:hypothetical protein